MHTERQRASSQAHKVGDEAKRLGAQCLELQRELESQTKEAARLKARPHLQPLLIGTSHGMEEVQGKCVVHSQPLPW